MYSFILRQDVPKKPVTDYALVSVGRLISMSKRTILVKPGAQPFLLVGHGKKGRLRDPPTSGDFVAAADVIFTP